MTRLTTKRAAVTGGAIHCQVSFAATGRALLLLHAAGSAGNDLLAYAERLAERRAVIIPDLPGQGATGPLRDRPMTVAEHASRLAEACRDLGFARVDVLGIEFGAVVAAELAYQHVALVAQLTLIDTPLFPATLRAERLASPAGITDFERAYLEYDLARTLAALRLRVRYFARRGGGFEAMTDQAARLTGALPTDIPAEPGNWPLDLLPAS